MELVGMEIRKNFEGFGVFTGTVQSYDAAAGYFMIRYEDGDSEEVSLEEITEILKEMGGSSPNMELHARSSTRGRRPKKRRRLGRDPSAEPAAVSNIEGDSRDSEVSETLADREESEQGDGGGNGDESRRKKSTPNLPLRRSARRARIAAKYADVHHVPVSQDTDLGGGRGSAPVLVDRSKPELPPSSRGLDLDGLNAFDLFSVYSCLRSFCRLLFLSPFRLQAFVVALRCSYANSLIDSVHFSILQALRPHLEVLSEEGSNSASECLRYLNWELLDLVTWPVFLVHYLKVRGTRLKPGFRLNHLKLLDSEYYKQPAGVKLEILRCLCDDVIEVEAIRSELNKRMDSEINLDASRLYLHMEKRSPGRIDPQGQEVDDGNIDECCLCGMDGSLICCDGCPAAFHSKCVGVAKDLLPEGDWYCPECLVDKSNGLKRFPKPSRGAELLGFDPHGRLYFGSCDHLLVSDSWDSDTSYHYYSKDDLGGVISVLNSCYTYSGIVSMISAYWGVSFDASTSNIENGIDILDDKKKYLEVRMPSEPQLPSKNDTSCEKHFVSPVLKDSDSGATFGRECSEGSNVIHLHAMTHENLGKNRPCACSESCDGKAHAAGCLHPSRQTSTGSPMTSVSPPMQGSSLENTNLTAVSEDNVSFRDWSCIDRKKAGPLEVPDPYNYFNYYSFGRTASSISAELLPKLSIDNSLSSTSSVDRIKSTQLKAISSRISRYCCNTYEKLYKDVQKEKCGWCFHCRSSGEFDCLFKVASEKKLKGFKRKNSKGSNNKCFEYSKIQNGGPASAKVAKGHITSLAHHILSIEDRARTLLSGQWEKPQYSQQWRNAVLNAPDIASLKPLLLNLELNLRRIALSVEWSKPVDDAHAIVSASIVTSPVRGSAGCIHGRKVGKKNVSGTEFSFTSRRAAISDIYWWRGGRLSQQLFQCKMLPRDLALKGGRQAGCRKIPHMLYPDSSDFGERSKYVAWRVAVEMSQSVPQLLYQVKDLDSNIKWEELFGIRIFPKGAMESKKMAKSLKKVHICGRCKEGEQLKYLLDFSKLETVPNIVLKHGIFLEDATNGRKRYWLSEAHVPLNLLKAYEEKRMRKKIDRLIKKSVSGKHKAKEIKCKTHKRKRSECLSYLVLKEQKPEVQLCGHCNKDVPVREAVNCQLCCGFFHRKHFRLPKGVVTMVYTCSKCKEAKEKEIKSTKAKAKDKEHLKLKDKDTKKVKVKDMEIKIAKAKEEVLGSTEVTNSVTTKVYVKPKSRKSTKAKQKDINNSVLRNKKKKNIVVEENCRRSERVKQKSTSLKGTAHGRKTVSKSKKLTQGKKSEIIPEKGRRFITIRKKSNGHKRRKKGKSKNLVPGISLNGFSWRKRKRSVVHHSYWLNGLLWSQKPLTEQQRNFQERNIILPFQETNPMLKPICCLCGKENTSQVIYIRCESCKDWFHGDAFGLTLENIINLIGIRCHKCRKRSGPVCPFANSNMELDIGCGTDVTILSNDRRSDEEKHHGNYLVNYKEHSGGEQRGEACVVNQIDEEKNLGSLDEHCSTPLHNEDHLDELHGKTVTEGKVGLPLETILANGIDALQHSINLESSLIVGHQNVLTKRCSSPTVLKEDLMDCEQSKDACIERQEDIFGDNGALHGIFFGISQNEDHFQVLEREKQAEVKFCFFSEGLQQRKRIEESNDNDHQNDGEKHCHSSIFSMEEQLTEKKEGTRVEHQKDEKSRDGDQSRKIYGKEIEEYGLSSEAILTNGQILGSKLKNVSENSYGGSCEDLLSPVQRQDEINIEDREVVLLCKKKSSLPPKGATKRKDEVMSPQQVEAHSASLKNENETEVGDKY